jgi:hypothetical protein
MRFRAAKSSNIIDTHLLEAIIQFVAYLPSHESGVECQKQNEFYDGYFANVHK